MTILAPDGYVKEQYIVPPEAASGSPDDLTGYSIAISDDGSTLAIGAKFHPNNLIGSVFIYTRSETTWTEEDIITPSDTISSVAEFGWAVALSADGNTLVVGGPWDGAPDISPPPAANEFQGAVWIYTRSGGVWTEEQKITNTGAVTGSFFGESVDITPDGNKIIIGDTWDRGPEPAHPIFGQAFIYDRVAGTWSLTAQLSPSDADFAMPAGDGPSFGYCVKFVNPEGTLAVISGVADHEFITGGLGTGQGAVWTFKDDGGWSQLGTKLTSVGLNTSRQYGHTLAACPSRLLVTSWRDFDIGPGGTTLDKMLWIYTWDPDSETWTEELATDVGLGTADTHAFYSVAVNEDGNFALICAQMNPESDPAKGSIVAYTRDEFGVWTQSDLILPSELVVNDALGFSVDITRTGNRIALGAPNDNSSAGSAFVYRFKMVVSLDGVFVPLRGT